MLFSCMLLSPSTQADQQTQESFIAVPKPKKESDSTIKEGCGNLMLINDKKSAYLHIATGDLQKTLVDHEIVLINQEKNSFFVTAKSAQLQKYRAVQEKIGQTLDNAYNEIKKLTTELNDIILKPKE